MGIPSNSLPGHVRLRLRETLPHTPDDVARGSVTFALPWPPSLNRLWINGRGGRRCCTPRYKAYKDSAAKAALACGIRPYQGKVNVTLTLHFPPSGGDVDNRAKACLDAMNGVAWADDRQVNELHTIPVHNSDNPRVVITIKPAVPARIGR